MTDSDKTAAKPPQIVNGGLAIGCGLLLSLLLSSSFALTEEAITGKPLTEIRMSLVVAGFAGTWLGLLSGLLIASGFSVRNWPERFGLRIKAYDLLAGIPLGVLAQIVLVSVLYLPVRVFAPGIYDDLGKPAQELTSAAKGWGVLVFAFGVGVVAPVLEELFFRGLMLKSFSKWISPAVGIGLSAAVFGAIHLQPIQFPALFALGLLLALIVRRTGRLGLAIGVHMGFNLFTVSVLLLS